MTEIEFIPQHFYNKNTFLYQRIHFLNSMKCSKKAVELVFLDRLFYIKEMY